MSFRLRLALQFALVVTLATALQLATTVFFFRGALHQLGVPEHAASAWIARIQAAQLLYGALGAALTLALTLWFVERQLVRPLQKLQGEVERWAGGELAAAPTAHGDVHKLAQRIGALTRRVQNDAQTMATQERALSETEAQLTRTQQLALVGQFAAGLAHEVGNPLGAVMGYVSLLRDEKDPAAAADLLTRIEREVGRIHSLVRELLDYARPKPLKLSAVPLAPILAQAAELVRHQPRGARITIAIHGDDTVLAEPERLKQVFVNLMLNAADAMRGEGAIEVTVTSGERIEVTVQDHGGGFSAAALAHATEPFFTTKPPGEGTGLGLAVCESLVREQRGTLTLANHEDGARITVRLQRGPK
jgi:signal transduction histidine kinase